MYVMLYAYVHKTCIQFYICMYVLFERIKWPKSLSKHKKAVYSHLKHIAFS